MTYLKLRFQVVVKAKQELLKSRIKHCNRRRLTWGQVIMKWRELRYFLENSPSNAGEAIVQGSISRATYNPIPIHRQKFY